MPSSDKYFNNEPAAKALGDKTTRSGMITVAGQGIRLLLQVGSTVLLARLLTPDDFGLFGMAAVVINFVTLFKDFGLSTATLQRAEIKEAQISNLFWINVLVSILIGLMIIALSEMIAAFYGRAELAAVSVALGGLVAIQGFGLQHRALIARRMEFGKLAIIAIISQLIGVSLAVVLALGGYGYWALIVLMGIPPLAEAISCCVVTAWLPLLPQMNVGTAPYLKYGSNLLGFSLVNYFSRNLDNILIGKFLGANVLGLYNMSYNMLLLPMQQINVPLSKPVLVALSRIQNDVDRYRLAYRKSLRAVATFTIPIVFFLASNPELILTTTLGEQWKASAPLFLALTPFAFVSATNVATGWVYASLGHTDRQFRMGIFSSTVMVISIIIGMQYGALGVAIAASLASCVLRVPTILYCFRYTPLGLPDFLESIKPPTLKALLALMVALAACKGGNTFGELPKFVELLLLGGTYWLVYLLLLIREDDSESFMKILIPMLHSRMNTIKN
jgi:O-antigen/teichoic acid export membrane protein